MLILMRASKECGTAFHYDSSVINHSLLAIFAPGHYDILGHIMQEKSVMSFDDDIDGARKVCDCDGDLQGHLAHHTHTNKKKLASVESTMLTTRLYAQ